MKRQIIVLLVLLSTTLNANFNFGECAGSGTFEHQIEHYGGTSGEGLVSNFENTTTVGSIPQGIQGLRVSLISAKDVDIRLYGENEDKIVHWPYGIHFQSTQTTKPYKDVNVTYSGYNGVNGQKGHEFIEVEGSTPTAMTMKAFGYKAGYATVNYSWTGKDNCTQNTSGTGNFTQTLQKDTTSLVGTIPPNVENVQINLTSDKDLDIQLYGADGTAIASWKPTGIMAGATKQSILYNDMNITWSVYNGVDGKTGHEYITITPVTTEVLVMKVFGYEAGSAEVTYSWGDANTIKSLTLSRPETYIQEDGGYGLVQVPIKVMATYEDGQIEEVTDIVSWKYKDKKEMKCYVSSKCLIKHKDGTAWASLDGVTSNKLHVVVKDDEEQLLKINKLNDSKYDYVNKDGAIEIELQKRPTSEVKLKIKLKEEEGIRFKYSNLLEKELIFNQNKWKFRDMIIFENVDRNTSYSITTEPLISEDPYYNGKNPSDIILEKKESLKLIEPLVQERRGAIRGVSITFRVLSTHEDLKYELINPLKGMRIIEGQKSRYEHQDAYITYLGGADIKWDVPVDIEEKTHTVTVKATDIKGNTAEVNFPLKVPKTIPIQTKTINNELIVTDKSSNLYGMKMKGHSGEDISGLKIRSVAYKDVWKKRVKNKQPEDIVERTVFVIDNMPEKLDVKFPNYVDSVDEAILLDTEIYKYTGDNNYWYYATMTGYRYENTNGLVLDYQVQNKYGNNSNIFMLVFGKYQNRK